MKTVELDKLIFLVLKLVSARRDGLSIIAKKEDGPIREFLHVYILALDLVEQDIARLGRAMIEAGSTEAFIKLVGDEFAQFQSTGKEPE